MDKRKYYLQKLANRKTGYPIVTIAYYGPDDQFASKVVVGFIASQGATTVVRKWFADAVDARKDEKIQMEMAEYIEYNRPYRITMMDRIIGCPHEEGIDYPEGEVCPQCPFWANRDRWTGEIIAS
ncbi:MAG TPA: hypothetical protein VMT46_11330 [Anaerolineaceae bacterium]|nr:hypothetical protein [Anaerolineaceae bacterium]